MIRIEREILKRFPFTSLNYLGHHFVILTDESVAALYGHALLAKMERAGQKVSLITFPPGERSKNRAEKERIEDEMARRGVGRDGVVIALGGGVVTDLAGFVAATYCRGIPFVAIPTTLLAMVDACCGGKVAINTPWGKNLIGAFHSPSLLLIDPDVLQTLPKEEMLNGKAEILKYGWIADPTLLEETSLEKVIETALRIKMEIVSQDPFEKGVRAVLNFGHTFGHAVESLAEYSVSHGQAVALGMALEAKLSAKMKLLPEEEALEVERRLKSEGFSLKMPQRYPTEALIEKLRQDKKGRLSQPRFVLLEKRGKVHVAKGAFCQEVPQHLVTEVWEEYGNA